MEQDYADYLDEEEPSGPTTNQLAELAELANRQVAEEAIVKELERQLAKATQDLKNTAERDIPNLMDAVGVKSYSLTDGTQITIDVKVVAGILEDNRPVAFEWLHKNGASSIIKRTVALEGGRGDSKKLTKLRGYINRWFKDFKVTDKEAVHAAHN